MNSPLLNSHWNQQDSGRLSAPLRALEPARRLTKVPMISVTSSNTSPKQGHQAGPAEPRADAQAQESWGLREQTLFEGANHDSPATVTNKLRMKWKEMESSLNPTDSWQITSSTFMTGKDDSLRLKKEHVIFLYQLLYEKQLSFKVLI